MEPKDQEKRGVMTPLQAANEVEPSARIAGDPDLDDPREELGWDQPESSAQKLPEAPGADRERR
jgi:hypothetical protein